MRGTIVRRGKQSWRLKFDIGRDQVTGKRETRYITVRGARRDAEGELARVLHELKTGAFVDPSKTTLAEFLDRWEAWAATQVSPKTHERYKELAAYHVQPHLGAARIQKLRTSDFATLYARLQRAKPEGAGLAPRTVGHVHRLLHRVFKHAVKWGVIGSNPVAAAEPPRVERTEVEILTEDQVREVLRKPRGRSIYPLAALGLATGMRRGELLALRWKDIDLDGAKLRVERSLEQTKRGVLRFKSPKTKSGRRNISLAPYIVAELRAHWKAQQEQRLVLGLGKAPDDALVFAKWDGTSRRPDSVTKEWARAVKALKLPAVTLHAWRHTHASQLIASGLDVLTVSRRLGHSSPTITLGVYGHLFANTDDRAAQVMQAAFGKALTE